MPKIIFELKQIWETHKINLPVVDGLASMYDLGFGFLLDLPHRLPGWWYTYLPL